MPSPFLLTSLPPDRLLIHHLPGLYEPVSALSHLLGAAAFLLLGLLLLRRGRGDPARVASLSIFAASAVLLLTASGIYHMTPAASPAHNVLLRLDHAAIFLLIAGTFTPAHVILFQGPLRYGPLLLIWSAAAAGIALKTTYFDTVPEWAGLTLYLTLGWLGLVTGSIIARRRGFPLVRPLLLGGIAYSAGALIDFLNHPTLLPGLVHAHELFHLAVLAGLSLHFAFIWRIAADPVPRRIPVIDPQRRPISV